MADDDTGSTSCKLWLLQLFVLLGLLAFFIWLGIRPKSPSYIVTQFSFQNGSISFEIEIENPNKDSQIYYADSVFTCYNSQQRLGSALIRSFSQDKEESTPQSGVINLNDKVRRGLEIANKKAQLQVDLATKIRYRTWGIKSQRSKVQRNGQFAIGPDGKIPGKTKLKNGSKKWRIKMT